MSISHIFYYLQIKTYYDMEIWFTKDGDSMRNYYLFLIKPSVFEELKDQELEIYILLKHLFQVEEEHINYGIDLYKQTCDYFDIDILSKYLKSKFRVKEKNQIYRFNEQNQLIVKPSYLLLKTDVSMPSIFRYLQYISPYVFVCDFEHGDYFYLRKFMNHDCAFA